MCATKIAEGLSCNGASLILATAKANVNWSVFPWWDTQSKDSMEVLEKTRLTAFRGSAGDFMATLDQEGSSILRNVSGLIIAEEPETLPGFDLYGLSPCESVVTLSQIEDALACKVPLLQEGIVVFLLGLAEETLPFMTRRVMRSARDLQHSGVKSYVFYGNLKVADDGLEALYRQSRQAGVKYMRFSRAMPGICQGNDGRPTLSFIDETTANPYEISPDLTVVDERIPPDEYHEKLARLLGLHVGQAGFLQSDNTHRLSVKTNRRGILSAGPSRGVFEPRQQKTEASNAVSLTLKPLKADPRETKAEINPGKCVRCLSCYRLCPHGAVLINGRVNIAPLACEGCGICIAACPRDAIRMERDVCLDPFENGGLFKKTAAEKDALNVVVLCCNRSAIQARNLPGDSIQKTAHRIIYITMPCAGRLSTGDILDTFRKGADGVLILTCHQNNCYSEVGFLYARTKVDRARALLRQIGVNEDRLVIRSIASNMGAAFARIINDFTRGLADLGPSPLIGACPEDETIC